MLITGGSGFVGTYLTSRAAEKYQVYSAYYTHTPNNPCVTSIKMDLTNEKIIQSKLNHIQPEIIIHTAAISKPDVCEKYKGMTEKVNIQATEILAGWAKKHEARFIFTSSDMVFDGKQGNYSETDSPNPLSFYGETKALAEQKLMEMESNCAIARVALVYGIGTSYHSNFFHAMVKHLQHDEKVNLFHDQFRTPIYVGNLAEVLIELAENNHIGIIHLGGKERISRWDFGLKACEILDLPEELLQRTSMYDFPSAASRPRDVSMDIRLANHILNTKLLDCSEGLNRVKLKLR